jgi:hypothetical protein
MSDITRELTRLKELSVQQEVILDAHIETFNMMKEDRCYDQDDVRRHGLGGLDREKKFNKLQAYVTDYELVMKWLNHH